MALKDDFTQRLWYEDSSIATASSEDQTVESPFKDSITPYVVRKVTVCGNISETWAASSEVKAQWVASAGSTQAADIIDEFEISGDRTATNGKFKTYDSHVYLGELGKVFVGDMYFRVANNDASNTHAFKLIVDYQVLPTTKDTLYEAAELLSSHEG